MASGPITSWLIDGEAMETVTDFIFLGSKITVDSDCSYLCVVTSYIESRLACDLCQWVEYSSSEAVPVLGLVLKGLAVSASYLLNSCFWEPLSWCKKSSSSVGGTKWTDHVDKPCNERIWNYLERDKGPAIPTLSSVSWWLETPK